MIKAFSSQGIGQSLNSAGHVQQTYTCMRVAKNDLLKYSGVQRTWHPCDVLQSGGKARTFITTKGPGYHKEATCTTSICLWMFPSCSPSIGRMQEGFSTFSRGDALPSLCLNRVSLGKQELRALRDVSVRSKGSILCNRCMHVCKHMCVCTDALSVGTPWSLSSYICK